MGAVTLLYIGWVYCSAHVHGERVDTASRGKRVEWCGVPAGSRFLLLVVCQDDTCFAFTRQGEHSKSRTWKFFTRM